MAGELDAATAARQMQREALARIEAMRVAPPGAATQAAAYGLAAAAAIGFVAWQRRSIAALFRDAPHSRLAYAMVLPSIVLIFLTVLYPLAYNVVLSFSNMSLTNLRDWDVVGLRNYAALATGREAETFWRVFVKTLFWTG